MWLPLQLVLEFLGRSVTWLAVMTAFGAAAALIVALAARWPWRSAWPRLVLAGLVGAVLGASLADRFGLPEALVFGVWRRAVPLAWSAGGALCGAAVAWGLARLRRPRPAATTPPDPNPAEAAGGPDEG
jgi:hypothetical protein